MSSPRNRDHELLRRMCLGEAYDLDIDQAGGLPGLHHVTLRDVRASLRPDHPDRAFGLQELVQRDEALQIAAIVGGKEDRVGFPGSAEEDGRAARLDLLTKAGVPQADEQHALACLDTQLV